ncbi:MULTISPECIES: hypothetical protein [unclassified Sporolactobacillus]|uniref:hypothetical protein n=1 Tax=unclassified Sporolactobacillus TaxID=2628533 RepID=UPI002367BFDD|nr:hypothetical protein [Sporolactobacillus sp. CQH2019]MDD9150108.1 hypothetical protein [Sporolactobacillus sp. CQH2019]
MRKLRISFVLCFVFLIFIGLAATPLISFTGQAAEAIRTDRETLTLTVNLLPILPLLILGLIELIIYPLKRKKRKGSFWLNPLITPSEDEREKAISAEACRKAFAATWVAAPFCAVIIAVYPFFAGAWPIFPVMIVLLIPFVQMTVYLTAVRKIYRS